MKIRDLSEFKAIDGLDTWLNAADKISEAFKEIENMPDEEVGTIDDIYIYCAPVLVEYLKATEEALKAGTLADLFNNSAEAMGQFKPYMETIPFMNIELLADKYGGQKLEQLQQIGDTRNEDGSINTDSLEVQLYFRVFAVTDIFQEAIKENPADLKQYITDKLHHLQVIEITELAKESYPNLNFTPEEIEAELKALEATKKAVKITEKGIKNVEYPLDKINNNIWTSLLTADKNGQLTMAFDTMKQGAELQPLVIYSIDFSALEDASIIKKLTAFDKRVYIAVNGLYSAGYDIITINQIYSVITNRKTKPNSKDREKINKSLSKMAARLHLDNTKELTETYAKYPRFKYDGALLPFDRIEAEANGNITEAIRIYRPASEGAAKDRALPLVQFAKQRGQYTTITSRVFGALSLTDGNLEIEDYLIEQIGHIKRGLINPKMLYESILAATHQTTRNQRARAKEKIHALLEHFQTTGFIKDYEAGSDGITIVYEQQKAINQKVPR